MKLGELAKKAVTLDSAAAAAFAAADVVHKQFASAILKVGSFVDTTTTPFAIYSSSDGQVVVKSFGVGPDVDVPAETVPPPLSPADPAQKTS